MQCARCGEPFTPSPLFHPSSTVPEQRYCGKACKQKARRSRHRINRRNRDPEAFREWDKRQRQGYKARRAQREGRVYRSRDQRAQDRQQAAQQKREATASRRRLDWEAQHNTPYPEDAQERRRVRQREYRRTHPEQQRAENRRYRERYPEKVVADKQRYEMVNREQIAERRRQQRAKNPEYRAYLVRQSRKYKDRLNEIIPNPRKGERWTAAEDRIAMRDDITPIEICYMLGRSHSAVHDRRVALRKKANNP